jgi:hypothetical protein
MKRSHALALALLLVGCSSRAHVMRSAPSPESLVTVHDLLRRLAGDSTTLVVLDGVPLERSALDSVPETEVVSAAWVHGTDCRMAHSHACQILIVERCDERAAPGKRPRAGCPWALPANGRVGSARG